MEPLVGKGSLPAVNAFCVAAILGTISFALMTKNTPGFSQSSAWSTTAVTQPTSTAINVVQRPTAQQLPRLPHTPATSSLKVMPSMQADMDDLTGVTQHWHLPIFSMAGMTLMAVIGYVIRAQRKEHQKWMEVPLLALSTGGMPEIKVPYYDDPGFQALTIASFPDKAIANADEARVLWAKDGYDILDVRSDYERSDRGPLKAEKGTVNIPMFFAKYVYDPAAGKKVVKQEVNPKWLDQVKARFPNKDAKIIIMCSDGRRRSVQALELLDEQGYTCLVGMKGGYNQWDEVFDRYLRRRDVGIATEVYNHVDSEGNPIAGCGIHASGAGFEMMDSLKYDKVPTKDPVPWGDWTEAVQELQAGGNQIAMFATTGEPSVVDAGADSATSNAGVSATVAQMNDDEVVVDLVQGEASASGASEEIPMFFPDAPPAIPPAQLAFENAEFEQRTLAEFPEKTLANYEEARVLWSLGGYEIVDVRSEWEREENGRITALKGSICIPLLHSQKVFNDTLGQNVIVQEPNAKFLEEFRELFPDPQDKVLLMDSDGHDRALQAMGLLHNLGYVNVCAIRGGFNAWNTAYDSNMQRHFSDIVDVAEMEQLVPQDPITWLDWSVAMDPCPLTVKG